MTIRRLSVLSAFLVMLSFLMSIAWAGPSLEQSGSSLSDVQRVHILSSLKLTSSQRVQMQRIQEKSIPQMSALFGMNDKTIPQKRKMALAIRQSVWIQMLGVLTPDQKTKLKKELQTMSKKSHHHSQ